MRIDRLIAACLAFIPLAVQAALPIQHWTTAEGARVYFVETRLLPMLDVAVSFPAGSARDTAATSGLATLTHTLLDQGAGGLADSQIAHRLADVGAQLGGSVDRDRATVSLRTLSSEYERNKAIDVLLTVLHKPDFPSAVVEREKRRLVAALREAEADPGTVASRAFMRAVYGDHPYARDPSGEVATVEALDRAQVEAFYRSHYGAVNAVIVLVGDLARDDAEALAQRISAGLPDSPVLPPLPEVSPPEPRLLRIAHPAQQSHVLAGTVGMARGDADFFPLLVGNYIVGGGGFDSRLLREIRDKRGFAYSAYSYFMPLAEPGPFQMGLQTQRTQADEALGVALDVLRAFISDGPSDADLEQAKANLIGGFPLRIDSNRKILDFVSVIGFYDLPLDYLDTWTSAVARVSREDVTRAFRARLDADRLVRVIVGSDAP